MASDAPAGKNFLAIGSISRIDPNQATCPEVPLIRGVCGDSAEIGQKGELS